MSAPRPDSATGKPAFRKPSPPPRFSVIVPLVRAFGVDVRECVTSWCQAQTVAPHVFEVLLVASGTDRDAGASVSGLLRPADRLLRIGTADTTSMWDAGAREAAGTILVITEAHCVADSRCLEELARYFDGHDRRVALCSSRGPATANIWARLDQRAFEKAFPHESVHDDAEHLHVHGLAIDRALYLELGGFDWRFGRYGEQLFQARLRAAGHRIGNARHAVVTHHYRSRLREHVGDLVIFLQGAWAYQDAAAAEAVSQGQPPGAPALPPTSWELLAAGMRFRAALLRCWFLRWREDRLEHAHCDLMREAENRARLQWLANPRRSSQ